MCIAADFLSPKATNTVVLLDSIAFICKTVKSKETGIGKKNSAHTLIGCLMEAFKRVCLPGDTHNLITLLVLIYCMKV